MASWITIAPSHLAAAYHRRSEGTGREGGAVEVLSPQSSIKSSAAAPGEPGREGAGMPPLKGSQTEANLKEAFAGESQANRRYLYFAQKADVEGYPDVAAHSFRRRG